MSLRTCLVVGAVLASCAWGRPAFEQRGDPPANANAVVVTAFEKHVQDYMDLRQKAVSQFDALKPDADQATIAAREHTLGEAIRTARAGAKAGDLFSHDVAAFFRRATKADFAKRSTHGKRLRLDELPHFQPVVNQTYPSSWPLQTFPPTLLANLPRLPPELEYRFVDNALVLRDTKANLVVDFLRDVM